MSSCTVRREEHCKQISLASVGSACSVWTTLGLHQLTARLLSQSTLLSLQVALQGNCPKWALGFVHFPGLSCSGLGSWGTDSVGHRSLPFPGLSSLSNQVLGERIVPGGLVILITSPVQAAWFPRCAARAPSQVYCVSPLGS